MYKWCDYAQCPGRNEAMLVLQAQGVVPALTLRFHQSCAQLALERTHAALAREN